MMQGPPYHPTLECCIEMFWTKLAGIDAPAASADLVKTSNKSKKNCLGQCLEKSQTNKTNTVWDNVWTKLAEIDALRPVPT